MPAVISPTKAPRIYRFAPFDFTIQTTSGETDWHVNTLDADGDLTINFDRNLLARHNARLVPPLRLAGAGGGGAGPTPREVEAAVGKIIGAAVARATASARTGKCLSGSPY
jgi:hypothetical protein